MNYQDSGEIFKHFKQSIQEEAKAIIDKLKNEINQIKFQEENQIKNELLQEKVDVLSMNEKELTKKYQNQIANNQRQLDLELSKKRDELFDSLFVALTDRIKKYQKTPQYKKAILQLIDKYNLSDFEAIEVSGVDDYIKELPIKVIVNNDILAGFRLIKKDKKQIIDQTLNTKIDDAKEWFYQNAKWFKS